MTLFAEILRDLMHLFYFRSTVGKNIYFAQVYYQHRSFSINLLLPFVLTLGLAVTLRHHDVLKLY